MREIKYRIYIPDAPQLFGGPMYYQGNQYLSSFLKRVYSQFECDHPSYLPFQLEERLELFTGLQDKNNKDIYENDILKSDRYPENWLVEYDVRDDESTYQIPTAGFSFPNKSKHLEIIGNKSEHPELLTSE